MTSSSWPFTYSSKFSSSDERISTSPFPHRCQHLPRDLRAARPPRSQRVISHTVVFVPRRGVRVYDVRRRHRAWTSAACSIIISNFKHVARKPALVNPGRALAFARASLVAFFALLTSISRAVAPFSRREARATILRAQDDLYQEFSGTYPKPLVLDCLPIQN